MYTKSLDVISICRPDYKGRPGLPTWVPDWSSEWDSKASLLARHPYHASGDTRARIEFKQLELLSADGFVFDACDSVATNGSDYKSVTTRIDHLHFAVQNNTGTSNSYGTTEKTREALWRTMVADRAVSDGEPHPPYEVLLQIPGDPLTSSGRDRTLSTLPVLMRFCAG